MQNMLMCEPLIATVRIHVKVRIFRPKTVICHFLFVRIKHALPFHLSSKGDFPENAVCFHVQLNVGEGDS